MRVESVAVFFDRYFEDALRFDSRRRALRISSGSSAGVLVKPLRRELSWLLELLDANPTGILAGTLCVIEPLLLAFSKAVLGLSGMVSSRSEGTDEWVESECIDSPEQMDDESKASSASVSA